MAIYRWNIQDISLCVCVCVCMCVCVDDFWFYLNCVRLLVTVVDYSHNARNKHYSIYYFLQSLTWEEF